MTPDAGDQIFWRLHQPRNRAGYSIWWQDGEVAFYVHSSVWNEVTGPPGDAA